MIAVTGYEWLKFLHVLAAIVWVGSSILLQLLGTRAVRSGDPARQAAIARDAAWAGQFVFGPASLAALGLGIGAVIHADLDWGSGFISAGLALYVASSVLGGGVVSQLSKRVVGALDTHGEGSAEFTTQLRRLLLAARLDLLVLLAAVAVMTLKP